MSTIDNMNTLEEDVSNSSSSVEYSEEGYERPKLSFLPIPTKPGKAKGYKRVPVWSDDIVAYYLSNQKSPIATSWTQGEAVKLFQICKRKHIIEEYEESNGKLAPANWAVVIERMEDSLLLNAKSRILAGKDIQYKKKPTTVTAEDIYGDYSE